jgi:hypothetical protein
MTFCGADQIARNLRFFLLLASLPVRTLKTSSAPLPTNAQPIKGHCRVTLRNGDVNAPASMFQHAFVLDKYLFLLLMCDFKAI